MVPCRFIAYALPGGVCEDELVTTAIGSYATAATLKATAGITDSDDDTLLGLICDRVNQFIESKTGRVLAPITSATYYYDGDGSRGLYLPVPVSGGPIGGIRSISELAVAPYSGASYEVVPSTDYFLRRQAVGHGPFEYLVFTDVPTSTYTAFPRGYSTVKLTGTAGWAAIPDDIIEVAITAATRAWFSRQNGQQDIVGSDENGAPLVSRFFSARDLSTLRHYTLAEYLA